VLTAEAGWQTREGDGARVMRCGATDRWGRAATGPGGQRRGAGGREKSEAARRRSADRRAQATQCRGAVQTWHVLVYPLLPCR
jgi:hypothetical protein